MTLRTVVPSLFALLAIACGESEGSDTLTSGVRGPGVMPSMAERYQLQSKLDVRENPGFVASSDEAVGTLHDFKQNPGQTVLDVLSAKKVPIASTIKSKIPGPLQSSMVGWFNDEVRKLPVDGGKAADAIETMEKNVRSMFGKFELLSTLEVPGAGSNEEAKHTVTGLAFNQGAERIVVDAEDLVSEVDPADKISAATEKGETKIGDHAFSLPIGSFVGRALDLADKDKLAKNGVRFLLGRIVDCDAVAKNVSKRCMASVCIGHEPELKELCDVGLDVVSELALSTMKKFKIDPLHLVGGTLKLPGADKGGLTGIWNGAADLGKGEHPLVSKVTGIKL